MLDYLQSIDPSTSGTVVFAHIAFNQYETDTRIST